MLSVSPEVGCRNMKAIEITDRISPKVILLIKRPLSRLLEVSCSMGSIEKFLKDLSRFAQLTTQLLNVFLIPLTEDKPIYKVTGNAKTNSKDKSFLPAINLEKDRYPN